MHRFSLRIVLGGVGLVLGAIGAGCGGADAIAGTNTGSGTEGSSGGTSTSGAATDTGTSGSGSASMGTSGADTTGVTTEGASESSTGEPCRVDADCEDDDACTSDRCGAAGCTNDPIDDQPASTGQLDGDCQVILCVAGALVPTNSDNDVPVDGNVCTDDVCTMGVPSNPDSVPGTMCNEDGLCDGAGTCSECVSPDDCDQLPPDDDCQTRTCESNVCGQVFTDAGIEVDAQAPGDCMLLVCNGSGGVQNQVDDTDVPNDGFECTDDVCDDGMGDNPPLDPGVVCSAGICDGDGACVGCVTPADCGGVDTFCRTFTCEDDECGVLNTLAGIVLPPGEQTDGDCVELQCDGAGNIVPVPDDADEPDDDGNDCTDEVCVAGNPDHPDLPIDTDCSDNGGTVCNGAGDCVGCNEDDQCPSAPQCSAASCTAGECEVDPTPGVACEDGQFCTANDSCNAQGACTGGTNPCPGPDGDSNCAETCDETANACTGDDSPGAACSDGQFCTTGDVCDGNGTCNGGGSPCLANVGDNDSDCTESCNEGTDSCIANDPNGSTCTDGAFCTQTDTCTNGVCGGTGNPCTANVGDNDNDCSESCNEATNNCTTNDLNGSSCNDGAFCTVTDTCTGGVCGGTGNPCTANLGDNDNDCSESCNEGTNNCTTNDPNGAVCNDGAFCTQTDTCTGGVCGGTGTPCPGPDNDSNCNESCNEATNNCTQADPNNSSCSDGAFCTSNDRCQAGTCVGGADPCDGVDGDTDCSEQCDETNNNCSDDDPNGSLCDVSCFIDGACLNGGCVTVCP